MTDPRAGTPGTERHRHGQAGPGGGRSAWMRPRRTRAVAAMLVPLVAIVISACSSGAADDEGKDSSGGASQGQLVVALPFPISGLDLTGPLSGDRSVLTINRQLFDSLTQLDDATGELKPQLATKWEATDDTTWTFTLRTDAKFHNGATVTSADVKASFDALIKAETPLSPILSGVTAVEAPDPATVVIRSSRPLGPLPRNVALMGIAPAKLVGNADFLKHPVGSGPFEFVSFSESELKLKANPDYWGGAPGVQDLVFRQIPEATARVAALQTGEVDLTWGVPPDQFAALKSDDQIKTKTVPGFLNYEILINTKRPPLDKLPVRQALVHAIDSESIIDHVLGGLGTPAKAPLAQTIFGSTQLEPFGYDPDKARSLLQQAGGGDVKLSMLLRPQDNENQVALAIVSQWAKVGIKVKPDIQEIASWTEKYVALDFDLALTIRPTLTGDADYTLGRLYDSAAKRVPCANSELDKLIRAGSATPDEAARKASYQKALDNIWSNVCGVYPIDVEEAYAWQGRVKGLVPAPSSIPLLSKVTVES